VTEENLVPHCGHSSGPIPPLPLLLLGLALFVAVCQAWLISLLNFDMPASAEARTVEAALRKLVVHLDEDTAVDRLGFDSSFLLLFKRPIKGKLTSGFFGPGQL
jgi:hypothetical protein